MKKNIINKLLCGATFLMFASCGINEWNDKLPGFEGDKEPTEVKTIEYTLTNADYASLAANSKNKALAGEENEAALKLVGTKFCFNSTITPNKYMPAYLEDPNFPYFTLSNGSSIKMTYNVAVNAAPEIDAIQAAKSYKVTTEDYQEKVWESYTDFVNSFAPSKNASKYIPTILKETFSDATAGSYAVVNYETSAQEPVFGGVEPPTPFTPTSIISTIVLGNDYDIKGIVTGICLAGYIITDNSGSLFVYYGNTFDATTVAIGDQMAISGNVGAYNKGFQLIGTTVTAEKIGAQSYKYPAPEIYDGVELDAAITRTDNQIASYVQLTGTVAVSGNNINIVVDGAATAKGSVYYTPSDLKEKLIDGTKVNLTGYFIAIAGGKYLNMVATDVKAANSARRNAETRSVVIPTTNENAVYVFNGSAWSIAPNTIALNSADYAAMGQPNDNLSTPDVYIPTFLKVKYPYAQSETSKFVVYKTKSNVVCDQYSFNGTEWIKNNGVVQEIAQFVKNNGKWMYDPNVNIILQAGKGQELSAKFYQACVDWVFENIDKPLGSTSIKGGKFYISSFGNNEYYSGTSAFQGNVDLRASSAKTQYPDGYKDMTDVQIVDAMKLRFCTEVMSGALTMIYPDAAPIAGLEVMYTITFGVYDGSSTTTQTVKYQVIDIGKFKPISCTWYENGTIPAK